MVCGNQLTIAMHCCCSVNVFIVLEMSVEYGSGGEVR